MAMAFPHSLSTWQSFSLSPAKAVFSPKTLGRKMDRNRIYRFEGEGRFRGCEKGKDRGAFGKLVVRIKPKLLPFCPKWPCR